MSNWRDAARALGVNVAEQRPTIRRPRPQKDQQAHAANRPDELTTMIGQDEQRTLIMLSIAGARARGAHLGHFLIDGPPGCGKSSLAYLIAQQTGGKVIERVGADMNSITALRELIKEIAEGRLNRVTNVVYIDEIHELRERTMSMLLLVMENFQITLTEGRGVDAEPVTHKLPPFVLVASTTMPGTLSRPFMSRFENKITVDYYDHDQLAEILARSAESQGAKLDPEAAQHIAQRGQETPRIALHLLTQAWNYACMFGDKTAPITLEIAEKALNLRKIDDLGLDEAQQKLLKVLCRAKGRPVGLNSLATSCDVDPRTIQNMTEPYLVRSGLIERVANGRKAKAAAFRHLGLVVPARVQTEEDDELELLHDEEDVA